MSPMPPTLGAKMPHAATDLVSRCQEKGVTATSAPSIFTLVRLLASQRACIALLICRNINDFEISSNAI